MISEHKGDLLQSGCDIICHQVNLQGVMGGGLARQIATKYPTCEEQYKKYLQNIGKENALYDIYKHKGQFDCDRMWIVNCFSQDEDFTTNYEQLKAIVKELKKQIKNECNIYLQAHIIKLGIPKNYGCGIANGDWNIVNKIWSDAFKNEPNIELQIWEL